MSETGQGGSDDLVLRLNANEPAVWDEFVARYQRRLLAKVQRSFPDWLRAKLNPADVVQQVFQDIILLARSKGIPAEANSGLWPLLCTRAARRMVSEIRKARAARRDLRRDYPWSSLPTNGEGDRAEPADTEADRERQVILQEQFVRFVQGLELTEQVVVNLRLEPELDTLEKV